MAIPMDVFVRAFPIFSNGFVGCATNIQLVQGASHTVEARGQDKDL
jgi:hypothetical protein